MEPERYLGGGVILAYKELAGRAFLERLEGRKPLFVCVIGTTETAKIPGISAAGKNPDFTDYTPPADVELLLLGRCRSISGLPVTPEGIPTPALITRSALKLADIPTFIVSGGLMIEPHVPFLDLGGSPGEDIRRGRAVKDAEKVLQRARILGEELAKAGEYLVIGESIPGGTTTALGVLLAMGVDARDKVSSSMPNNPHLLKVKTVEAGFEASRIVPGSLAQDPLRAISCVGDPVMPAFAGLVLGAAQRIPVLMAGGTQMGAILAIIKALNPSILANVAIGTTRWIISDKTSDLKGIVAQIADIPIFAADLNFGFSNFPGLRAYEMGFVKEGVGAGGAAIAAMLKSRGTLTSDRLLKEIEANYELLTKV